MGQVSRQISRQISRPVFLGAISAILALTIGGCGGETPTTESPTVSPSGTASVAGTPPSPDISASPGQQATNPAFPNPTVSSQNSAPRGLLPPDLISSTDPNQRVRQVQSNRADPFALLPTTPTVQLPPPPPVATPASTNSSPSLRQPSANRTIPASNGRLAPIPNLVPRTPSIPIIPPPPQPNLARAVKVTGVVQVGDSTYAIVSAPNEPTSRYVQAGQRLSNGQVLVRRIETRGLEPRVVLEENGIEVDRAVGEGGIPATPSPAAAIPNTVVRG
ncbi:MAG: hypothetical protein HC772_08635 [Leptolyngbyaceae cyanobacterium CRU_2_3]|nr:hypothetical protein [Leptolyngbyaceae cyanobacterium CRU_2_3]